MRDSIVISIDIEFRNSKWHLFINELCTSYLTKFIRIGFRSIFLR